MAYYQSGKEAKVVDRSDVYKFKTFPIADRSGTPFPVVFGGDVANGNLTLNQLTHIAGRDPWVVFFGGDFMYDNGYLECYCIFDRMMV